MSSTDKGFSLLEMLLGMLVICGMLLLNISRHSSLKLDHYYYASDYLLLQSEAMLERREKYLDMGVRFNAMGHIDLARTIDFGQHQVIIHLGNGYAFVR